VYDVLRSEAAADFESGAVCIVADGVDQQAADATAPPSGAAIFYLVRAENGCPDGQGPLGTDSEGTPRLGRSCP
jgi:hypothetical protein